MLSTSRKKRFALPILRFLLPTLFFLGGSKGIFAQDAAPQVSLESPYNTIYVHLYYLQPDSYEPAKAALTLQSDLDSTTRVQRAVMLKQIYDGLGLYVELDKIPRDSFYVDSLSGEYLYKPFPLELPEIYVQRAGQKWYYSPESVRAIPALYKEVYPFGADFFVRLFPRIGQHRFLGLFVWQYLGALLILLFLLLLHQLLSRVLSWLVSRLTRSKLYPDLISHELAFKVARYLSLLALMGVLRVLLPMLQLPILVSAFVMTAVRIFSAVFFMMLFLRVWDIGMLFFGRFIQRTDNRMDDQLLPLLRKLGQILIVGGAVIQILRIMDVNVTAIIAGLSIGGLALALAAQDTVKNFIGSLMIFVDSPFQIGDWIDAGGFSGEVLEVGFRSTRLRLLDSSVVSIPNGNMANMSVVNRGVRVYRLMDVTLGITYDTPPQKIEAFMQALRKLILEHPVTNRESYYVHLTALADSSLNILFRVPLLVSDYASELKHKEDILLSILRLAEELGVDFAFPSTSVYLYPQQADVSRPKP